MIHTITLNPSIDKYILVDRLAKDDTLRATDLHQDPGGKGINVSRVLKELGAQTKAFGFIGGCPGYMLKSYMMDREIPFDYVEIEGETRINVIISDTSDNSQTRISVPGPHVSMSDVAIFTEKLKKVQPQPSFWVMGGNVPRGLPRDMYRTLIKILQQDGVRCVLDADDEALRLGVEAKPFMIKPNEFELARLANRELSGLEDYAKAAREIAADGIGVVAVTLGKKGMIVATHEKSFQVTSPDVKPKSKVGAGDSTVAGIVYGLEQGKTLEESARLGVAAGTAAVLTEGTQLCTRDDVYRLLPQIEVQEISAEVRHG